MQQVTKVEFPPCTKCRKAYLRLQWVIAIAKETNHEVVIREKKTKKEYIIK